MRSTEDAGNACKTFRQSPSKIAPFKSDGEPMDVAVLIFRPGWSLRVLRGFDVCGFVIVFFDIACEINANTNSDEIISSLNIRLRVYRKNDLNY